MTRRGVEDMLGTIIWLGVGLLVVIMLIYGFSHIWTADPTSSLNDDTGKKIDDLNARADSGSSASVVTFSPSRFLSSEPQCIVP